MEEFGLTNADLQSPSSLLGGASSSTGWPLGAGLGGLTFVLEGKDVVADGVGIELEIVQE